MRTYKSLGVAVALAAAVVVISAAASTSAADPPQPGPNTLWSFLGIPQGVHKVCDACTNKNGNHPDKERQPALKRIADPQNLQSQNPAIKAAAKIKSEEDLAPQKIKAIKYLATIGCGCYPGVREALLDALDDCTEEVRYEAAIAFCQAAGNPCRVCNNSGCCNAAVMTKLDAMAHGQDDKGCWKEPSARVRAAAENALNACRRRIPASTAPAAVPVEAPPPKKELPIETPPTTPDTNGSAIPPVPRPPADAGASSDNRGTMLTAEGKATATDDSVSATGFAQVEDSNPPAAVDATTVAYAGRHPLGYRYVPCPQVSPGTAAAPEQGAKPAEEGTPAPGEATAEEQPTPEANALAGTAGAVSGPASAAPNMIGDLFGSGGILVRTSDFSTVAPTPGNAVPRFKMADDTSPLPQDRLYFDYNFYENVPIADPAISVSAFAPGFEKTFFDGLMSFELRAPMATTLNSDIFFEGTTPRSRGEFGDLGMALKTLLLQRERFALSGGLAMTVPTAADERFFINQNSSDPTIAIKNESVHLMPFFGALWTPNDRWFSISYVQVDVDVNGSPVSATVESPVLTPIGRYRDQTFMYIDSALGYWAYRNRCPQRFLTGLAPVFEVHVNQSLEPSQIVTNAATGIQVGGDTNGNPIRNITIVDLTVGLHAELCGKTTLTAGYCVPTTGDRQFDGEFACYLNRRF